MWSSAIFFLIRRIHFLLLSPRVQARSSTTLLSILFTKTKISVPGSDYFCPIRDLTGKQLNLPAEINTTRFEFQKHSAWFSALPMIAHHFPLSLEVPAIAVVSFRVRQFDDWN